MVLLFGAALIVCPALFAQDKPLELILERLSRLEQENRALREEVHALRDEVGELRRAAAEKTPEPKSEEPEQKLEERVAIQERRIEEQAQTKVESSQKFPIRITGMALFNAFLNSRHNGGADNPLLASADAHERRGGGTFRQTVIGLQYQGPGTIWGGKVRGSLYMDFFAGTSQSLNNLLRIRTAAIELEWKNSSLLAGQEKPIFAPREPNSLAQVGYSPLSRAGNLWRWQPQVRYERRFGIGSRSELRAQIGMLQTSERPYPASEYAPTDEFRRPALEGRFEFAHTIDDTRRLEIAPGFHTSTTHIAGQSVPSNLFSLDWFANPWRRLEFSGAFFSGQNVNYLGGLNAGYTVLSGGRVIPVHARGGWSQFTIVATDRLSFNLYGGQHDDRNSDLLPDGISRNMGGAANFIYRLAPNVLFSFEAMQLRTTYLPAIARINNHYDLALAYLF